MSTAIAESIKIETEKGYFDVMEESLDPSYRGIDVEFVPKNESETAVTNPRIVFEVTPEGKLRLLIWKDPNNEDYTQEIIFDNI